MPDGSEVKIVRHHHRRQIDADQERRPDGLSDAGRFARHRRSDRLSRSLSGSAGDLIAPERVVRITGTDRSRRQRAPKFAGARSNRWPKCRRSPSNESHIRLNGSPGMSRTVASLLDVFKRHPGASTVVAGVSNRWNLGSRDRPLPNLTVSPSDHFVADVEEVLGKGPSLWYLRPIPRQDPTGL